MQMAADEIWTECGDMLTGNMLTVLCEDGLCKSRSMGITAVSRALP